MAKTTRRDCLSKAARFVLVSLVTPISLLCGQLGELRAESKELAAIVQAAFLESHDGWSSDEVLLQEQLNKNFQSACLRRLKAVRTDTGSNSESSNSEGSKSASSKSATSDPISHAFHTGDSDTPSQPVQSDTDLAERFNWTLLNLRKAGKLSATISKRRHDQHTAYRHLAEIVARSVQDLFKVNTDRIMCNPAMRAAFDKLARQTAPDVDPYLMRKAAFGLRKARRLRPELVLRVADWDRTITTHRADQLAEAPKLVPPAPGIYIFRDATGYLYIGEAINLQRRLKQHLDESDRRSLAQYIRTQSNADVMIEIHAFPKDSRAKEVAVRRAYESELIASRNPRFNVRP